MANTAVDRIQEQVRGRVFPNASLAELTTLKVGGPADVLVYPADREDLRTLLALLAEQELPRFVLGNGSNLVVRDAGLRGAVLCLTEGFRALELREETADRVTVWVEAGVNVRRLVRWSVDEGITGFEFLCGIPGTLGGAVIMNAGAWGQSLADRLVDVEVMDPRGTVSVLTAAELDFGYRTSKLPAGHVVLGARLWGRRSSRDEVKGAAQGYYQRRKDTQPLQDPSAGSTFKNPPQHSAGKLIDQCGLKGVRVGDAEISKVHANFIVNQGRATASHVVALIGMIQERVYVKFKLRLEPEVHIVGEWEKGKLRITE